MNMKATMSNDGLMRLNLRSVRRISFHDLVDAAGWSIVRGDWTLEGFTKRNHFIEAARIAFDHEGDNLWTWTDELIDKELIPKLNEKVAQFFSELKPPAQ